MKRVWIGGILAGVVVFLWGAISHMALPLGMMGLQSLPNDDHVMMVMRQTIPKSGLYFFPGMESGLPKEQQEAANRAFEERLRRGPSGLIAYTAEGTAPFAATQLVGELLSNIAGALVAAFLLSMAAGGVGSLLGRAIFVALLGLFASVSIEVSYWNWYRFPTSYLAAQTIDQVVGWFLGGLVLGAFVRKAG